MVGRLEGTAVGEFDGVVDGVSVGDGDGARVGAIDGAHDPQSAGHRLNSSLAEQYSTITYCRTVVGVDVLGA